MNCACWVPKNPQVECHSLLRAVPDCNQPPFLLPPPPFSTLYSLHAFTCSSDHSERQRAQQVLEPQEVQGFICGHLHHQSRHDAACTSQGPDPAEGVGPSARRCPREQQGEMQDSADADGTHGQDRPQGRVLHAHQSVSPPGSSAEWPFPAAPVLKCGHES